MSDRERETSPESNRGAVTQTDTADSFLRAVVEAPGASTAAVASAVGRARSHASDPAAGEVIAQRYRLDEELGRGGMGVVWAATDVVAHRRVAIKVLRGPARDIELRRRFLQEALASSALDHPNVVEVVDVFELDDETRVIIMELLLGETLRDKLERERRLPLAQAATILQHVASAVGRGHALGVVHRDLKPENIFLTKGTAGGTVKVLDFGIAKLLELGAEVSDTDSITGSESLLGTPCYMAPEQTLGETNIDHRADIWAIGVILYECLAGVRPVQGSCIGQVVMKLATEGIRPLDVVVPDLPREATALVMRMLARDRADRPQGLEQVHEVLSKFADTFVPFATKAISGRAPSDERARYDLARRPVANKTLGEMGRARLATVESYLARLPGGIHAHPECIHNGQALSLWLRSSPTSGLIERLPAEAADVLASVSRLPAWVPDVHAIVLYLAIREAHFANDAAFLAHAMVLNRAVLDTPMNRVLFWVASPKHMLRAAVLLWSTLHRGSSISGVRIRGDRSAEGYLNFPAHLLPEIVLRCIATGFAAALENTGARDVVVEMCEVEPTRARFTADW